MIVYTLIHEYKEGFTAYAYSTRKKRAEARALLLKNSPETSTLTKTF